MLNRHLSLRRIGATLSLAITLVVSGTASAERLVSATIGLNYIGQGHCVVINAGMDTAEATTTIVDAATGNVLAGPVVSQIPPGTSVVIPYQALTANFRDAFCEVTKGTVGAELRMAFKRVGFGGDVSEASDGLPTKAAGSNGSTSAPGAPGGKTIFVSSTVHNGNLGGLAGADAICQGLAESSSSVVPDGEYVALLSDSSTPGSSRVTATGGPYFLANGALLAADTAALFSTNVQPLLVRPEIDETGTVTSSGTVWTGTGPTGVASNLNCDGWSTDGTSGHTGFAQLTGLSWLLDNAEFCNMELRIYCVQR